MLYEFESTLFQVEHLDQFPSLEAQPFFYMYRARTLLQQLLQKPQDPLQQAIIHYQLGVNLLNCEENEERNFSISIQSSQKEYGKITLTFSQIEDIENYLTYIQSTYNHLGFQAVNLDYNETGLAGEYLIAKGDFEKRPLKIQGGFERAQYQTHTHYTQAPCFILHKHIPNLESKTKLLTILDRKC